MGERGAEGADRPDADQARGGGTAHRACSVHPRARGEDEDCRRPPLASRGAVLEDGYDIRTVPELFGHRDVSTTMIYTRVLNRDGRGVRSPADGLMGPASSSQV